MKRNIQFIASVTIGCFVFLNARAATNAIDDALNPRIKSRTVEKIPLRSQTTVSADEAERIKGLIKQLALIDKPDFGLSATLSGDAFAPIQSARNFQAGLLTNHHIEDAPTFVELVKLGPKALPCLLDALDDQTETKLVITHDQDFGGMWFAHELFGNPANTNEQKILSWAPKSEVFRSNTISSYTVKVGDVCFVIIGQIVGRSYQAVRYQPTACIMINSPTHDSLLAKQVRALWASTNAEQSLLDSLLSDYASEGIFNGFSLDGWGYGSVLQCNAAMRLLYYFPSESENIIAHRLKTLDVHSGDYIRRQVENGVAARDLIKAVAWCKEPVVQTEIGNIFFRTDDADILLSSLVAMDPTNAESYCKRLEEFLSRLPKTERGPYGDGYNLLVALGQRFGTNAKPAFQSYMKDATLQQKRSMCKVLLETQGQWSIELLAPVLQDTRPAEGWTYPVNSDQDEPRLPIRICDEAAETIAKNFPKLAFKMEGQHKDLDVQIKAMQESIEHHAY